MDYALKLENVCKKYKDFELDHININLPTGCIMGFIGENGAGKTTTIKAILDVISHDSGNIEVLGAKTRKEISLVKENIGVVINESCFPEILTIQEIGSIMKNIFKTWDMKKWNSYLERFSLPTKKKIKELSTGMKTKLSIAVALSHDSSLLILDEATSGLDPIVRDEVLDVFLDFIQDESHSVFISSHILSDLEKICDYITFIHKGKILLSEPKDELLERYSVLKCSQEELSAIDSTLIKAKKVNKFGVEALVFRDRLLELQNSFKDSHCVDNASIEDIMLFMIKGGAY